MGGLEKMVVSLIQGVDPSRFRTVLCCIERQGEWFCEAERYCDAALVLNKKPGLAYGLPFKLARFFKANHVDIVHCHNFAGFVYGSLGARIARHSAVVYTVHGPEMPDKTRQRLFQRLPLVDAVVTVSEHMRRTAVERIGLKAERVTTIANGIPVRDRGDSRRQEDIKGDAGPGERAFAIGSVGRLSPEKDQKMLLRGFALVISKHPNARLLMVGDGPLRQELEACSKALGLAAHVRFLGSRPDVAEILDGLDLFVMSSREEGLPVALLEAMAAGLPVVATRVGGIPDVVTSGKTGILVPAGEPERLAEAINTLIEDRELATAIGLEGQKIVAERFDSSHMVARYEELYARMRPATR
jgi:sugar transferase (PEP-CTERM/EpsH1 system associated)